MLDVALFEDRVLQRILQALRSHPKLRQLRINSPTPIQQQEVDSLGALLDCKVSMLELGQVQNCNQALRCISDSIFDPPTSRLLELSLVQSNIDSVNLESFVSNFSGLQTLSLSKNKKIP